MVRLRDDQRLVDGVDRELPGGIPQPRHLHYDTCLTVAPILHASTLACSQGISSDRVLTGSNSHEDITQYNVRKTGEIPEGAFHAKSVQL